MPNKILTSEELNRSIADAIQKKMQSEGHKAASRLEKDWLKLYKDQMGGERDSGGGGR